MRCPNCGQSEKQVRVCSGCGGAFATEDLQTLSQLEFMLKATSGWEGVETLLTPYRDELRSLRIRLKRVEPVAAPPVTPITAPAAEPVTPMDPAPPQHEPALNREVGPALLPVAPIVAEPAARVVTPAEKVILLEVAAPAVKVGTTKRAVTQKKLAPPKDKVPFDEWLLSERNIKFALYGGGLLLFIAGIIFVGVNWGRFPGPVKFAITLLVTGLTYLGGYLLYQRPAFRLGGVALIALACGFLTLNFAVLQIYVMGPEGLRDDVMWLIASPLCLIVYYLIAYWTRHELFTYISIAALASLVAAALVVAGAEYLVGALALAFFALVLLVGAFLIKPSALADFMYRPALFVAHGAMPMALLISLVLFSDALDCATCFYGSSWIALLVLFAGVIFYAFNAYNFRLEIFVYFGITILTILVATTMILVEVQLMIAVLIAAIYSLMLLATALFGSKHSLADITYRPFFQTAQGLMPLAMFFALVIWANNLYCTVCLEGNPWIIILVLIAGLIFYAASAFSTRLALFTYAGIVVLTVLVGATLVMLEPPLMVATLVSTLYALILLVTALITRRSSLADFTYRPFFYAAQGAMPLAILFSLTIWLAALVCDSCHIVLPSMALLSIFVGLIFYTISAYKMRQERFTYSGIAVMALLILVILLLVDVILVLYSLISAIFALMLLATALLSKRSAMADFAYRPFLHVAQGVMPPAMLFAVVLWLTNRSCVTCQLGTSWIVLLGMMVGVAFYAITNLTHFWLWSRWAAVALFSLTAILSVLETGIDDIVAGFILMIVALVELVTGYWVEKREGSRNGALPFHVLAGVLALFVTATALQDRDALMKVLFGDVVLLSVAAWIFTDYRWVYGAVWLFMLPIYLLVDTYIHVYPRQALLLGLLALNYVVAGYVLGRREKYLGWPFLSAAAFLSLVVFALSWPEPLIFSLSMAIFGAVYALVALWLAWPILLVPALLALDLVVLGANRAAYDLSTPLEPAMIISYAISGGALLLAGLVLRKRKHSHWAWVFYFFGAADLFLAYISGLVYGGWLAVGMSATMAVFLLVFAWLERDPWDQLEVPPVLTYLGLCVLPGGLAFLLYALGGMATLGHWPAYMAGLCALYVALGWLLRYDPLGPIYGLPLEHAGLALIAIPLIGALNTFDPVLDAITFAIAGLTLAAEAIRRKLLLMAYLAAAAFIVVIWAVLSAFEVTEPLAYVAPLAIGLLGLGWSERRQGRHTNYMAPTLLGLVALMGTTFVRSVMEPDGYFGLILLLESILAIAWGMAQRVRCYIQAAGIALIANAIVQLGPGFMDLTRWIQIALIGAVLLSSGLLALFKREEILVARHKATGEWRRFGQ
jgi:hypothetical protein